MLRYAGALLLGITLLTPAALNARYQDHDRDHTAMQNRHEWNEHEDPYWRQYLKEHRKKEHDWAHASRRERKDYWKWRDAHHDTR